VKSVYTRLFTVEVPRVCAVIERTLREYETFCANGLGVNFYCAVSQGVDLSSWRRMRAKAVPAQLQWHQGSWLRGRSPHDGDLFLCAQQPFAINRCKSKHASANYSYCLPVHLFTVSATNYHVLARVAVLSMSCSSFLLAPTIKAKKKKYLRMSFFFRINRRAVLALHAT
jgi:hypothetical protein